MPVGCVPTGRGHGVKNAWYAGSVGEKCEGCFPLDCEKSICKIYMFPGRTYDPIQERKKIGRTYDPIQERKKIEKPIYSR